MEDTPDIASWPWRAWPEVTRNLCPHRSWLKGLGLNPREHFLCLHIGPLTTQPLGDSWRMKFVSHRTSCQGLSLGPIVDKEVFDHLTSQPVFCVLGFSRENLWATRSPRTPTAWDLRWSPPLTLVHYPRLWPWLNFH